MKKKATTTPLASAPPGRAPGKPPQGGAPAARGGNPIAKAPPLPQRARVPPQRPVGPIPSPRKPKLVHAGAGGVLQDLFVIFPDLPRPPRPASRAPLRRVTIAHRRPGR